VTTLVQRLLAETPRLHEAADLAAAAAELAGLAKVQGTPKKDWPSEDVYEALSAERSVVQREVEGGTGPAAVRAQLEAAQAALAPPPTPRSTNAIS